jgi:cytochrome o ubiquinol oxidase subunit II
VTFINRTSAGLLALALPLAGCDGVLDPRGPIGVSERLILIDSLAIMLVIVVPVIVATLGFAWWFRASNDRATYLPYWSFSGQLELIVWAIPALVITFLGGIAWFGSHALDPFRPLESKTAAVEVEVVSLDWKWLFIYPNDGVASVNQLGIPTGVPVHFKLTSSGVMNSFFVPQLGSQIYTMAGMTSQLSLQADQPGDYPGISAQFSGDGFSDMRFVVHALSPDDYAKWIASAKAGGKALDTAASAALARQSSNVQAVTYHSVDPKLFDAIVDETAPPAGSVQEQPGGHSTSDAGGGG